MLSGNVFQILAWEKEWEERVRACVDGFAHSGMEKY